MINSYYDNFHTTISILLLGFTIYQFHGVILSQFPTKIFYSIFQIYNLAISRSRTLTVSNLRISVSSLFLYCFLQAPFCLFSSCFSIDNRTRSTVRKFQFWLIIVIFIFHYYQTFILRIFLKKNFRTFLKKHLSTELKNSQKFGNDEPRLGNFRFLRSKRHSSA